MIGLMAQKERMIFMAQLPWEIKITREEEFRRIRVRYAPFYAIVTGVILVVVGIWIGAW
jgi:cobalamin synthase